MHSLVTKPGSQSTDLNKNSDLSIAHGYTQLLAQCASDLSEKKIINLLTIGFRIIAAKSDI